MTKRIHGGLAWKHSINVELHQSSFTYTVITTNCICGYYYLRPSALLAIKKKLRAALPTLHRKTNIYKHQPW